MDTPTTRDEKGGRAPAPDGSDEVPASTSRGASQSGVPEVVRHLLDLADRLPKGVRSDWRDSNHYELASAVWDGPYWWLCLDDYLLFADSDGSPPPDSAQFCETEDGQKIGLLLDIAEALKAAAPTIESMEAPQGHTTRAECG